MAVYDHLNPAQKEAVTTTEGPLLVLAGAGSGKTRVLTHRIAYLIDSGKAEPYEILAITFTNKAANEMKERVRKLADCGDEVWVATFHSTCVRILRRFIDRIGYDTDFTIYDADDQRAAVRHVLKDMGLDPKFFKERKIAARISAYKNEHITPADLSKEGETNPKKKEEAAIYEHYERYLRSNNALDFDDLLLKTVELFEKDGEVLAHYQRRFRYILVDEYQDTNPVQFEFVYLLSKVHRNLMVVGDDDQSIYRFRGADIRNILEFESHFPGTKVVKLEQNYRSTTSILNVANASIKRNRGRKDKTLFSELGKGDPVTFRVYESAKAEAQEIIRRIESEVKYGSGSYRDYAILYRTNAQSRLFEEACILRNVPYVIVGGVNFYQRAEIKDMIAYLKVIDSAKDDQSTERVLNTPRRGIGETTVYKLLAYAGAHEMTLFEAICSADHIPGVERAAKKLREFALLIESFREAKTELSIDELMREILEKTDYENLVLGEFEQEKFDQKTENLEELISKAREYEETHGEESPASLSDFLTEIALLSDIDATDENDDRVMLFTIHGAKGLEFPTVFLAGLEEGVFPSYLSQEEPEDLEEERRLFYVGVTRAKRTLAISAAHERMMNGEYVKNLVSRFVREIPDSLLEKETPDFYDAPRKPSYSFGSYGTSGVPTFGKTFPGYNAPEKNREYTAPHPTFGKSFTITKASSLDYGPGDRVSHVKFGQGTVVSIEDGKKDYIVTVDFDNFGQKTMMASFAKLVKI